MLVVSLVSIFLHLALECRSVLRGTSHWRIGSRTCQAVKFPVFSRGTGKIDVETGSLETGPSASKVWWAVTSTADHGFERVLMSGRSRLPGGEPRKAVFPGDDRQGAGVGGPPRRL